ncbi:cytochrome c oxidase assembly protein [Marinobacterium sp. AK62]|uniref:Cytochrome c oxidase assembly protein CtaG n=1 Tax=Marinobacterium alkalitolerans TaxID=1542925 RepID=A0ABS3ZC08_9GAMM|nr:cytochrome c oxidase assembly protein [Marinobacterium alkalitolerans]MBP0049242.1 cytochrome c oxidase assembly protein [Marinobacterium alkalitolerans]
MSARGDTPRLVRRLVLGAVLMFGFGFAMVPLYDVFCEVTGLNGKITNTGPVATAEADTARSIKVRLIAVHNEGMPWEFSPLEGVVRAHPGEMRQTAFVAANPTARDMVAQAIPSVAPAEAAQYLHKVNCFCFERQPLQSGESVEMPLVFVIDRKLPEHIRSLTLSYTLFDISPEVSAVTQDKKEQRL